MVNYQCPVCSTGLILDNNSKGYTCAQQHHFDIAKEAYVNLLPVQHKHSKSPGDNKAMLQARHAFLGAGYYDPLVAAIIQLIAHHTSDDLQLNFLDLGCGEGFYSRQLAQKTQNQQMYVHGVDIAKFAIARAAKFQPDGHFAVASILRLPYPDNSFDLILRVFAPSKPYEISRVLKPGGYLLTVTPGPRHLWQLKELIYPEAKEHPENFEIEQNFTLMHSERLSFVFTPTRIHRVALLQMTPFAWRATEKAQQILENAENLVFETDFMISLMQLAE